MMNELYEVRVGNYVAGPVPPNPKMTIHLILYAFSKQFSLKLVSFFPISDDFIPFNNVTCILASMPFIRHMFGGFSEIE